MALPVLTAEQRSEALEKAAEARRIRAGVKKELKAGELKLSDVIKRAESDEIIAKLRVNSFLESLPGIGAAKAARIMDDARISPTRRVGGLGPHQREALISVVG